MKKETIIISLLIFIGLVGLLWWGRSNQTATNQAATSVQSGASGKSSLVAEEMFYNFGTISMKNGKVEKIFKVTNPTDKDVTLASVVTSCMCTIAYILGPNGERGPFGMAGHGGPTGRANEVIKAGQFLDIKVVYDPNAHGPAGVGPVDRFVDLTEESGGITQLEIKAVVTP